MTGEVKASQSRVFTIENRAGPENLPVYRGRMRAQTANWDLGARSSIREPDPNRYGSWKIVDALDGEQGLPELTLQTRLQFTASEMLLLARRGCSLDVQVHYGICQDPRNFNDYNKVLVLEDAEITAWSASELGALEQGQDAVIDESFDVSALDMYEILPLSFSSIGEAVIPGGLIDVALCGAVSCGLCGIPSDGCSVVFALGVRFALPNFWSVVSYTPDGGETFGTMDVGTVPMNSVSDALACMGGNLVVVSVATLSFHYAPIADVLNGAAAWTEINDGLDLVWGEPNDLFVLDAGHVWVVGGNRHVYFSNDITQGVTEQNGDHVGSDDMYGIHAYDEDNVVAVGWNNTVLSTVDGGRTWSAVAGPSPALLEHLHCVFMRSPVEWWVGTFSGRLYYTRDAGVTWEEKVFPGYWNTVTATSIVNSITFPTPTVGYFSHNLETPDSGRLLRTIDGGRTWELLDIPTVAIFSKSVVASGSCPNVVYAGGTDTDPLLGILIRGSE